MAKIKAKAEVNVAARNNLGRFIKECELAGQQTVEELVSDAAKTAKRNAPVGSRHDRRSIPIRESIYHFMRGRTQGSFGASARHAIFQEKGARPHPIPGNPTFKFFWENAGRWWIPGLYGEVDYIDHPGNPAQPFLEPALRSVMARWKRTAKKHYPN
jgi:HK97 gp10 family phage protein